MSGVAMNTGTTAAKEAGNMVDLDSNPTKLIEIVEIGKQLLMTRGALTTFSIANDVAKYFAIIPAMFILAFPQLGVLNVMRLATPESAILSAVIFNAVIIIALIPLALKGIAYKPLGAAAILRRNMLIYGSGRDRAAVHRDQGDRRRARGSRPGVSDERPADDAPHRLRTRWPLTHGAVHMPEQRPTADALLARIKEKDRARLRIYIGAAPGVGKTYEMLQEAHALRARGLDVVVGYVETYGRRDTEAQIKDLEVVPRRDDRVSRRHDGGNGRRRHHSAQAAGLRR